MINLLNKRKLPLFLALTLLTSQTFSATIFVNTTQMNIDVSGRSFITNDTNGKSGLYVSSSLTIEDLNNSLKNPSDAESAGKPAISLPEAIIAANNTAGKDTIVLQTNKVYSLSVPNNYWYGPTGLPPITSEIILRGDGLPTGQKLKKNDKGAILERSNTAPPMRLFFIMPSAYSAVIANKQRVSAGKLTLANLTIRGGYAKGGNGSGGGAGLGGAIYNQGTLVIQSSTLTDNIAEGGSGSDIVNLGGGGPGGSAIANKSGGFINENFIGGEASGAYKSIFGGDGGPDGSGGLWGLDNNGKNGGGKKAENSTYLKHGAFGAGGGLPGNIIAPATTTIENGNSGAFASGGGYGVIGGNGGFGGGGGQSINAVESISAFGGGIGTQVAGGGGAGLGGAIFSHNGAINIINSTISGNRAIGGNSKGHGGSAHGAAIFSLNSNALLLHSTVFNNIGIAGLGTLSNGKAHSQAFYTASLTGNGIQDGVVNKNTRVANTILGNPLSSTNTIVSNEQGGNLALNKLTFNGKNIVYGNIFSTDNSSTIQTPVDSIINQNPFPSNEALTDNGGLTQTILPIGAPSITVSPAIDTGDNATYIQSKLSLDQRRIDRAKAYEGTASTPVTVDIGSVETGTNKEPTITFIATEINDSTPIELKYIFDIDDVDIPQGAQLGNPLLISMKVTVTNSKLFLNSNRVEFLKREGIEFVTTINSNGEISTDTLELKGPLLWIKQNNVFGLMNLCTLIPNSTLSAGDKIKVTVKLDDLGNSGTNNPIGSSLKSNESREIPITSKPPSVSISTTKSITKKNQSILLIIEFSEPISGFDESDIQISNGVIDSSLVEIVSQKKYQTTLKPDGNGDISVVIPADKVQDAINLGNTISNTISITYDDTEPTISTSGIPNRTAGNKFNTTFSFSEEVTGFSQLDIRIENARLDNFTIVNKKTYTVDVIPNSLNGIRMSIAGNVARDKAGNGNKPLNEILIPFQQGNRDSGGGAMSTILLLLLASLILLLKTSRKQY